MSRLQIGILSIVIIILTGIRLIGFEREGVTYDEPVYVEAGRGYMKALSTLDFRQESWSFNKEHPPVTKYVYGIAEGVHIVYQNVLDKSDDITQKYTFARLMSVLLGSGTLIYTFFLARFFLGFWQSILVGIILGLNPLFFAHTRLAGHESVSMFFVTGMWYWYLQYRETQSKRYFLIMNLHAILAFGSRFNTVLAMIPIWVWEAISWYQGLYVQHRWWKKLPWVLIWFPVSLWVGVWLIFPYWWTDPIMSIQSTINHWGGDPKELFFGSVRTTPWTYYIAYFIAQTPVLLFIVGMLKVWSIIVVSFYQRSGKQVFLVGIFLIWFLWSFATIKQGGMRYILPLYVPFSIFAVMTLYQMIGKYSKVFISISAGLIVYLGLQLIQTQPYYLDYYSEVSGGVGNVYKNNILPIGFWGQGTLEVVSQLDQWVKPGESVGFYTILMPEHRLTEFLPDGVSGIYKIDKTALFSADWILQQSVFLQNSEPIPNHYTLQHIFFGPSNVPLLYLYRKIH